MIKRTYLTVEEFQQFVKDRASKKKAPPKTYEVIEKSVEIEAGRVKLALPIITVSEANCFQHWTKKHARQKGQKDEVKRSFKDLKLHIPLPCKITFTRLDSHTLDAHDNLKMSVKWIVDACAECILPGLRPGMADGDPRFTFEYDQIISDKKGIHILFEFDP